MSNTPAAIVVDGENGVVHAVHTHMNGERGDFGVTWCREPYRMRGHRSRETKWPVADATQEPVTCIRCIAKEEAPWPR